MSSIHSLCLPLLLIKLFYFIVESFVQNFLYIDMLTLVNYLKGHDTVKHCKPNKWPKCHLSGKQLLQPTCTVV